MPKLSDEYAQLLHVLMERYRAKGAADHSLYTVSAEENTEDGITIHVQSRHEIVQNFQHTLDTKSVKDAYDQLLEDERKLAAELSSNTKRVCGLALDQFGLHVEQPETKIWGDKIIDMMFLACMALLKIASEQEQFDKLVNESIAYLDPDSTVE